MNRVKDILRKNAKLIRKNIDVLRCSNAIAKHILNWDLYKQCKNVMLFYPIGSEYSLLQLLEDKSKTFLFPHVEGETMYPVIYDKTKDFITGSFGIKEPQGEKLENYSLIDMIFVPALAADIKGFRLGYGKGFYDRFLEHISSACVKVIPVSSQLVFDSVTTEPHDKSCDYLITENNIIKTNGILNDSVCQNPEHRK